MLNFLKPMRPLTEKARQAAVDPLNLRANPQNALEPLLWEVAEVFGVRSAIATVIDHDRMIVFSQHNSALQEVDRNISFCGHTILDPGKVMIVWNAATDHRFAGNPLVKEDPNIRFYAGAPILSPDGQPVGALCAIDDLPRYQALPHQLARLKELAFDVGAELERQAVEAAR